MGIAYAAVGQTGAWLHTMPILQAYQADLLRDLDEGEGVGPDTMKVLCHDTDLSLGAIKETACAISHSMAAMVALVGTSRKH